MKIHQLNIDCSNLQEQKHFYTRKFNFEVVDESDEDLTLKIGSSKLRFIESRLRKAYYHFAFNIPFSSMEKARDFIHQKVEVLKYKGEQIVDFPKWTAKSVYFHDPAGNVVELIGRQKFDDSEVKKFSEKTILNISEVGLPVFQVSSVAKSICKTEGISEFDSNGSTFMALGDHEGLFIVVDEAEKNWLPTQEAARKFPLTTDFSVKGKKYHLTSNEFEFGIEEA